MSQYRRGRYIIPVDGPVYDTWGQYHIARDLWNQRIREGRSDSAKHDFVLGERVEEDIPAQWHRVWAVCRHCGQVRQVYHAINVDDLNRDRWCIPAPRRWFQRRSR